MSPAAQVGNVNTVFGFKNLQVILSFIDLC
jgi:hypothetical protein